MAGRSWATSDGKTKDSQASGLESCRTLDAAAGPCKGRSAASAAGGSNDTAPSAPSAAGGGGSKGTGGVSD